MFKKKKTTNQSARQRPDYTAERHTRPAFSYHAQRHTEETTRTRTRLDASLQIGGGSFADRVKNVLRTNVAGLFLVAVMLVLFCVNSTVAVQKPAVIIYGTTEQQVLLQESHVYAATARSILTSSPLYRLKYTADTTAFSRDFAKKHPEVAAAQLRLPLLGQTPEIHITPANPSFEFVSSSNETFIIDAKGRIIQPAEPGELSLPRLQDQSDYTVRTGDQALSSRDMQFMLRLHQQLTSKDIAVDTYSIPAASRQLVVQVTGKPYVVTYTFEHDVLQQAGAHIATQQKLDSTNTVPREYIDVRVGDRVYYK